MKKYFAYIISGSTLLAAACGGGTESTGRGPIRLGDSSTIVTEKDSQYLKDDVMDLTPSHSLAADTAVSLPKKEKPVAAATVDTPVKAAQQTVSGYTIAFGPTKIVVSGLQVSSSGKQNPDNTNSLTYNLRSGNPGAAKLYVYGAKNVTIKQRYQSRLMLKSNQGTVDLRDLGLYSSGWNTVAAATSGDAAVFDLHNLNNISYAQVNNNKIKNAADRELRKRHANSHVIRNWMKEIKRVRSAKDNPCDIILDNVQWQISGTDAKGKTFQKTIRLDA